MIALMLGPRPAICDASRWMAFASCSSVNSSVSPNVEHVLHQRRHHVRRRRGGAGEVHRVVPLVRVNDPAGGLVFVGRHRVPCISGDAALQQLIVEPS